MIESDTLYHAGTSNALIRTTIHTIQLVATKLLRSYVMLYTYYQMYTASWCACVRVRVLTVAFLALSAGVSVHTDLSPVSVYLVRNFLEVMLTAVAIVVKT